METVEALACVSVTWFAAGFAAAVVCVRQGWIRIVEAT